jgi:hypothetical protein
MYLIYTIYKDNMFDSYGLFQDAVIWLFNSPDESLGFILADSGFDVWLVNGRGTKYSTMHTSLSPNDKVLTLMIYTLISIFRFFRLISN